MSKKILYFNFENQIYEYHLPAINNRRIVVNMRGRGAEISCEMTLEVWDDVWYAKSSKDIVFSQNGKVHNLFVLEDDLILEGYINDANQEFSMLVMEQNSDVTSYKKYKIKNKETIEIGSNEDMDIVIKNPYVSKRHATIYKSNGKTLIKDSGRNGTFVNSKRLLSNRELHFLDEIYIVGIKFIYLGNILAVNHSDEVFSHLSQIETIDIQENAVLKENIMDSYFSRAPRTMEPLDKTEIEIEGPPSGYKEKKQPIIFTLGPSITMPIPMILSVMINMNLQSGTSNPMMYFGTLVSVICSAVIGAGWAIAHQKYNKKSNEKEEQFRQTQYEKYIRDCETLLEGKHQYNKQLLEQQYLDCKALCHMLEEQRYLLWNRNFNHDDFMTIRIGKGIVPYPGQIVVPQERFTLDEDTLSNLPHQLYKKYSYMKDAVSTIDLQKDKLIGVIGNYENLLALMQIMVVQIAATHCYTDVKMVFLARDYEVENMEWVKWLPHFFSQDKKIRYIASEESTLQNISYVLSEELRNRQEQQESNQYSPKIQTHYVVFCTLAEWLEKETMYSYMVSKQNYGFTFVLLYGEMDRLPNECVRIIQWDNTYNGSYLLNEEKTDINRIKFDHICGEEAEKFAKNISGIYVNETAGGDIPSSIDFMEMMQIPKLEKWDLMKKYKENRVYEGIKALVGLTYGNKPMYLDIHEKRFGPHGLVAGTTGSGKSETLITFILSLAMNYHPDEVAFVLIDYKGGGMAAPFIGMPHLAGTITNIGNAEGVDESQTRRALTSIRSEIRRRQRLFSKYEINHIDAYIQLYRDGEAEKALPHLIIIADEFAELKKEQPEFISELVSTARVGRSLGIHLILATQKPGNVVDDEIWSNSRFKICLRVQDKQDSMGMLKRPEAAYLTGVGRAYMQIGNDEIFEMFQSGYAGAGYEAKNELVLSQHNEVSMIGVDGARLVKNIKRVKGNSVTQLKACVEYIMKIAEENGINHVKPLWLPPLSSEIYLEDVLSKYVVDFSSGLNAVVGLVDVPEKQEQMPAVIEMDKVSSLLLLGNVGVGKTTFLHTMVYSLAKEYSPEEIQFYGFDFSSRTLRLIEGLPHCGGIALLEEREKVERILRFLISVTEERKILFEDAGVSGYREYLHIKKIPMIMLIIDNYAVFRSEFESYESVITLLLREGFQYGIQLIITANATNDVGYRMVQNIAHTIALYLGEKNRYMDVIHRTIDVLPANIAGRGLWESDCISEFQTALPIKAANEQKRNLMLKSEYVGLTKKYKNYARAKKIHVIPKNEDYKTFVEKNVKKNRIPFGYDEKTLDVIALNLEEIYCYVISSAKNKSIQLCLHNLQTYAEVMNYRTITIGEKGDVLTTSYESLREFFFNIREVYKERSSYRKQLVQTMTEGEAAHKIRNKFEPVFVLIADLEDFVNAIYQNYDQKELLNSVYEDLIEKGKGLGVYIFAGMKPISYRTVTKTRFARLFFDYETSAHFGGKLNEQNLFSVKMAEREKAKELDFNIGSYMNKGKYIQFYMPLDEVEEA